MANDNNYVNQVVCLHIEPENYIKLLTYFLYNLLSDDKNYVNQVVYFHIEPDNDNHL